MLLPGEIDVAVLCGGLGHRLRATVPDRPKPLAEVGGRPFLDILVEYVSGFGFRRFIMCTGYKGEMIEEHFSGRGDLKVLFSHEEKPLGTGGALKHAEALIKSSVVLVLNGDSICNMDMEEFLEFHSGKNALASIALVAPEKEADYGAVTIDAEARITSFSEKAPGASHINAGVYIFSKEMLGMMPPGKKYSLEEEFFPTILDREVYGYVTGAKLIDIGTAERYARAPEFLEGLLRRGDG